MLDKIKKTPEITPTTIKKFDGKFEGEIENICEKCRFDIELNDGSKYEYKSYGEASINRISSSDAFLKQHLSYLGDATDINKIKYEFDAKKFSDRNKNLPIKPVYGIIWNKPYRTYAFEHENTFEKIEQKNNMF